MYQSEGELTDGHARTAHHPQAWANGVDHSEGELLSNGGRVTEKAKKHKRKTTSPGTWVITNVLRALRVNLY